MSSALYTIDDVWPGRLSVVPRPRGGDWLEDEVDAWKRDGIEIIVSLLTLPEVRELDLVAEAETCKSAGIDFIHFPIDDMRAPTNFEAAVACLQSLDQKLCNGVHVGIHCRQSIGRSGLVVAGLMVSHGARVASVVADLTSRRGRPVPETDEQLQWLRSMADRLDTPIAKES